MKFSANIRKVSLISDKTYLFLVFITYRWYCFNDIITKVAKNIEITLYYFRYFFSHKSKNLSYTT